MRKSKPSQPISQEGDNQSREKKMDAPIPPLHPNKPTPRPQRRDSMRAGLAVMAGRTAGALSRRFHAGGGTSIIGVVAQSVYPQIVEHLATELEHGCIMVTGTNGKTTTSSFIAAILQDGGLRVWRNREGSNMMRGVASSLVIRAQPNGHLRRSGHAISILEVDEAALPELVQAIAPRILVFTNVFRDQLDRYGEVESIITHWKKVIPDLPATTTLILNADDPTISPLGDDFSGHILYYGIDDLTLDQFVEADSEKHHQAIDARTCPRCGTEYVYDVRYYSHIGHYHCPMCGKERPRPDIRATRVQIEQFDRLHMQVEDGMRRHEIIVPLPGIYNLYNALAAITTAHALSIDWAPITTGIEQSKPVFGRGERIQVEGVTLRLLLAKNPTGFNEVLRTLFQNGKPRHVLFILNDNIADGQDISWIWDVDFERTVPLAETLVVAGTRALDLALRFKYAGASEEKMIVVPPAPLRAIKAEKQNRSRSQKQAKVKMKKDRRRIQLVHSSDTPEPAYGLKSAMNRALQETPNGETLFIIPTYTGLLEIHRELEERGLAPHYWEGRDA